MKQSTEMKLEGAKEKFGVQIKTEIRLNKVSNKTLFPEKMEKVNKLVVGLKLS